MFPLLRLCCLDSDASVLEGVYKIHAVSTWRGFTRFMLLALGGGLVKFQAVSPWRGLGRTNNLSAIFTRDT